MPEHIQAHSRMVCEVALLLTDGLLAAEVLVNRELVQASALLHDITKPRSFTTGEMHAQTGGEYLSALGYTEVGEIVRQHVILDDYGGGNAPSEAEVVNYADKRVLHDRIVPLDDRMDYILKRYAKTEANKKHFREIMNLTRQLEKRLFSYLAFPPEHLEARIAVKPL